MAEEPKPSPLIQTFQNYTQIPKLDIVSLRQFNLIKSGDLAQHEQDITRKKKNILDLIWASESEPRHLISSDSLGEIILIDLAKNQTIHQEKICSTWLYCLAIDPFGSKIFTAGSLNSKIFVNKLSWNKQDKIKLISTLIGHRGAIRCCKFQSETHLISGATDSSVGLWDLNHPQKYLGMLQGHMSDVLACDVSNVDRNIFLTGSSDLTVKIWDIRLKNPQVYNFTGPQSSITSIKFVPNTFNTFAVGSDDSFIRLFDVRMGKEIHKYGDSVNHDPIRSIEFSKSGRLLFAASASHKQKIWDTQNPTGNINHSLEIGGKYPLIKVVLSQNGHMLASVDNNNNFKVMGNNSALENGVGVVEV